MDPNSISPTFSQRDLDEEQKAAIKIASLRFSQIEEILNDFPTFRLKSIALTELEKTALIVNKAISRAREVPPG